MALVVLARVDRDLLAAGYDAAAGWKIVWCDGYGRPEIEERLIASGIRNAFEGNLMLEGLRANASDADRYKLVPGDHQLFQRES